MAIFKGGVWATVALIDRTWVTEGIAPEGAANLIITAAERTRTS